MEIIINVLFILHYTFIYENTLENFTFSFCFKNNLEK